MAIATLVAASTMASPRPTKPSEPKPEKVAACMRYHTPEGRATNDMRNNFCPVCGKKLMKAAPRHAKPTSAPAPSRDKHRPTAFGNRR